MSVADISLSETVARCWRWKTDNVIAFIVKEAANWGGRLVSHALVVDFD